MLFPVLPEENEGSADGDDTGSIITHHILSHLFSEGTNGVSVSSEICRVSDGAAHGGSWAFESGRQAIASH